jgi:hypothetical protein
VTGDTQKSHGIQIFLDGTKESQDKVPVVVVVISLASWNQSLLSLTLL